MVILELNTISEEWKNVSEKLAHRVTDILFKKYTKPIK
jgi:hypothetical protein